MKAFTNLSIFLTGVREELKQVTWPSREELIGSSLVVFVGAALLAIFISLCDLVLSQVVQLLLQTR